MGVAGVVVSAAGVYAEPEGTICGVRPYTSSPPYRSSAGAAPAAAAIVGTTRAGGASTAAAAYLLESAPLRLRAWVRLRRSGTHGRKPAP